MRMPVLATLVAELAVVQSTVPAAANEVISTPNASAAIGPYSQAIMAGDTLYLASQRAIDPATGELTLGTIEEETTLVPSRCAEAAREYPLGVASVAAHWPLPRPWRRRIVICRLVPA